MNEREFDALIRARAGAEVFSVPEETRARLDRALEAGARRRVSRRVLLVAAVLLVALAGIAYAAARGGSLRGLFATSGDIDPSSVVDVNAAGGSADFSFAIDEAYWEGGRLWFSYTVRTHGDGARLVAFEIPTLDGTPMDYTDAIFIEDLCVTVIEDGVNEITGAFTMSAEADGEAHAIAMRAWLLNPIVELRGVTEAEYTPACAEDGALCYIADQARGELGGGPRIALIGIDRVRRFIDASSDYVFGPEGQTGRRRAPDVALFKALGYAEAVHSAGVSFEIAGSSQQAYPVTGVAEDEIDMGGYTVRVPKFTMTHFGMNVLIRVYTDEKEGLLVGRKFDIQTADGTSLVEHFGSCFTTGGLGADEDGVPCFEYDYDCRGFLREIPARVLLVPYKRENGVRVWDEAHAVTLTLVAGKAEALPAEGPPNRGGSADMGD